MAHQDEIKHGIEYLRGVVESGKILRLSEPRILGEFNYWYYFVVTGYSKQWHFAASREQLSDLPGTRKYQESALKLARDLEQRFKNPSPNLFWTLSGRLLEIDIEWPFTVYPGRAVSYLKVHVDDKLTAEATYCAVTVTHQQNMFELRADPFQIHEAIANGIRAAVDAGDSAFYPSVLAHPRELHPVPLKLHSSASQPADVAVFLKRKLLNMGFRSGGKDTQVWIADPWDADYLNVTALFMRQEAEILDAEQYLVLSEDGAFASTGRTLLLEGRGRTMTVSSNKHVPISSRSAETRDVFLSHASEDKLFVRELASELQRRNVSCWFDEGEITLGDSLRRAIDDGLRTSRFGVVVLSERFFAKEWPQRELDGILALEIDRKMLLPVWHGIGAEDIRHYSPMLAGRYAAQSSEGAAAVADKIVAAIRASRPFTRISHPL